jgi:hypothetical protein
MATDRSDPVSTEDFEGMAAGGIPNPSQ